MKHWLYAAFSLTILLYLASQITLFAAGKQAVGVPSSQVKPGSPQSQVSGDNANPQVSGDANQTGIAAPLSRTTADTYDPLNRLNHITDPASGVTQLAYDAEDDLTSVKDPRSLTPNRAREELAALAAAGKKNYPLPSVSELTDLVIRGAAGPMSARRYKPARLPAPTVVHFHGGGWVAGDVEGSDRAARLLAIELEAVVLSVEYRRPPETAFPGTFDDCLAAVTWAASNIDQLGRDPSRLGVAGESAGATLAACVAQACRRNGPRIAAQLLAYPPTDLAGHYRSANENAKYPSRTENANGYFLTTDSMNFFSEQYVPNENDARVTIIDVKQRKALAEISVGVEPEGMAISPDDKIVVNTSETTNMAHFIDVEKRQVVANVLVDARPRYAEWKNDASEVWVSSEVGGSVSVIYPVTHAVTTKITFSVPGGSTWGLGGYQRTSAAHNAVARSRIAPMPILSVSPESTIPCSLSSLIEKAI